MIFFAHTPDELRLAHALAAWGSGRDGQRYFAEWRELGWVDDRFELTKEGVEVVLAENIAVRLAAAGG